MDYRILAKTTGGLFIILALIVCVPGVFSVFAGGAHTMEFFIAGSLTVFVGFVLWAFNRKYTAEMSHRTGFAVVSCAWISACVVGALPYYFSGELPAFVDSLFESISGFSGTGASVIQDIEAVDRSILLWRSITQWLGGMGIIVFFIAILPILGLGGVQLFKAEITGPRKDKITPRVRETAKKLWLLYLAFTVTLALALRLCGMSGFDAVNHALTTISTGGFSTRAAGIAAFDSAPIEYIVTLFMFLSSINFALHYRFITQRDHTAVFSTEFKWYAAILAGMTLTVCFTIFGTVYSDLEEAFRKSLFTVVCTASSTGFTNTNYITWPVPVHYLLVLLMAMGGMSGSTAGGIKCIRLIAALKQLLKEIKQVVHPSAVLTVKSNHQTIPANIISAIWGFIFLYFFVFSILSGLLVYQGLDLVSASTATFSALSNIGPALGDFGPYDNYSEISNVGKGVLASGMLLGRLEFYTILAILTPDFWKK